jgi:hypothetical protein
MASSATPRVTKSVRTAASYTSTPPAAACRLRPCFHLTSSKPLSFLFLKKTAARHRAAEAALPAVGVRPAAMAFRGAESRPEALLQSGTWRPVGSGPAAACSSGCRGHHRMPLSRWRLSADGAYPVACRRASGCQSKQLRVLRASAIGNVEYFVCTAHGTVVPGRPQAYRHDP